MLVVFVGSKYWVGTYSDQIVYCNLFKCLVELSVLTQCAFGFEYNIIII